MGKRINPRRRPATQADVERAKTDAQAEAINIAMAIFFTVLCDKEHADKDIMRRVWDEVNDLSDSISKGYVSVADLRDVLKREYDIEI
jgi:hypothetical protein